mmetsp:Transcript_33690/g.24723  ORF Transcript_33690/g.24723 Transcript_33690/m.24723 type:complete len:433 (+) Transcript_33690:54-1352(+)
MIGVFLILAAVLATAFAYSPEEIIREHLQQFKGYTRDNLCVANKCCTMSATESCSISDMSRDQSMLVLPGGETRCIFSTSTPYAFQVIPGDSDKLLFYFQGGGACWDENTTVKAPLCTTDVSPQSLSGIFDRADTRNEYRGHTVVFVTYCSGDVHGGDITQSYKDSAGVPVQQKGVANAQSALDWVKAQVAKGYLPSTFSNLVVMGCSAGSIGAQIWAKQVLSQLSWQTAAVVPDSYAGIFPDGTMGPLIYSFGFCNTILASSDLMESCLAQTLTLQDIDKAAMNSIHNVPFAFIQSKTDIVQQSFYISVGVSMNATQKTITPTEFYNDVNDVFGTYNKDHANFLTYLVNGDQHCFTPSSVYYTATGAGPRVSSSGTTDLSVYEWTNTFPLKNGGSQITECDGSIQAAEKLAADNTYCSSKVVPKTFTEKYT